MFIKTYNNCIKGLISRNIKSPYQGSLLQLQFNYSSNYSDYEDLKRLAGLMKTTYFQMNEQIDYDGDVRIIDSKNKQGGQVVHINEALSLADKQQKDLVMVNAKAKPAIVKIYNQKDELYKQFSKEFIQKEEQTNKKKKTQKKNLRINSDIQMGDLKTKCNQAQDLGKKNGIINLQMFVNDSNVERGKNKMNTIKDMLRDSMIAKELTEREVQYKTEEYGEQEDNEDTPNRVIELQLNHMDYQGSSSSYDEGEIKMLVKQFFKRTETKNVFSDDQIMELTQGIDDDEPVAHRDAGGDYEDFNQELREEYSKGFSADDYTQRARNEYMKSAKDFSESDHDAIRKIEDTIIELKLKFNTNSSDQAIVKQMIEDQQKRLKDKIRLKRIIGLRYGIKYSI